MAAKAKSSGGNGNIVVVAGTDEGLVKERALELYREMTGGVDDGFTHETIDGVADNSDKAHEICGSTIQALQTLPMFGGDKVVWLRNASFLSDDVTGRSERTLSGVEALRKVLEAGVPQGVKFLVTASAPDKRRAFWKFLEKAAEVEVHDRIDTSREGWQDQVARLVDDRARDLGLRFEPDALALFVMLAGEATQQIGNELEKLDLYLGERRTVTEQDVFTMVPLSRAGIVFEIGNALQKGDAARAIALIDQQLEQGDSAIAIIRASIIPTVRNLFMAKVVGDTMKVPTNNYQSFAGALDRLPEIERAWLPQKKTGGVNVYPVFLALRGAAAFTLDGLRKAMEATLKADQALVTTGLDHRLVLHRLIAEITATRPQKRMAARS
ncbi:DNA polymerase III subunit delta [Luteolibacter ambystomatis]|uniref:DNA polymerase III subunit delta n=1 Tax=Luteolibacter ambystomatis TaxID=2824561 RepID=A0A975G732_9BACT|nr:DNA polymerase III subunit delta [Luteolibacter ambystomatis]QUE50539.1 DNA polymerase III subunit delta [Luteolibacter ambystomatis]